MRRRAKGGANLLLAGAVGIVGFVALLEASSTAGVWATPLRVLAMVWLLGFGLLKLAMDLVRR